MTDNLKNTNLEAEGVEIISNIEFGKGGKRLLLLDAFRLKGKQDKPMPVIIWIHGGGWSDPNLDKMYRPESQIIRLVKRGYFCVSIEYRLSTESVFPAQIQDCKCAVRFLRAKADEYNIDPEKIGVWGESAGGHLAALLGVTEDVKEFEGN
ncbi:MAG: alpha/beta hydrolase, partial [Clostridiales bacterium]|nr:alpha/beta hydrolase [Clostridiales bacterium]